MEHISTKEQIIRDTGEHGLHVLGNAIDMQVNEKQKQKNNNNQLSDLQ